MKKDLGLQRQVKDALPYQTVGGAWEGSFTAISDLYTALVHIVPAGQQLKVLFLRVWTQRADGAKFSIVQTKPTEEGQPGYPAVGSVEYDSDSPPGTGVKDYPMLEAAGCETLRGSLEDPVHVLEGSVNFNVLYPFPTGTPLTGDRFGIVYWGVEKIPE